MILFVFFKQKPAYELRIIDWSSDVRSSDLGARPTLAGERFMRESAVGAGHLREAVNEIAATKRGDACRLRIGLMTCLASGFLSELFDAYHRRFPDVEEIGRAHV